jgi:Domain of unknown function (DUF4180)
MSYQLSQQNGKTFIECLPGVLCLQNERDALDLVAACGENDTPLLLLYAENLAPTFFDLSTRLAGEILLKFTNYRIRAAAVLTPELATKGKFGEFVLETNRGRDFRVFYSREEAVSWLTST